MKDRPGAVTESPYRPDQRVREPTVNQQRQSLLDGSAETVGVQDTAQHVHPQRDVVLQLRLGQTHTQTHPVNIQLVANGNAVNNSHQ